MKTRSVIFLLVVVAFLSFPQASAAQWAQTGGRVFISRNGGTTWVAARSGSTIMDVSSLSVVGTDLYAGVWSRVLVSKDEGATWMELGSAIPGGFVHGVVSEGPNLFAWSGEQGGLQDRLVACSTDKGVAWKPIDSGLTSQGVIEVECLVVKEKTLFAGAMGGVFVTADNGASWTSASIGLPEYISHLQRAVSGQQLFLSTYEEGVYLSINKGASWTPLNSGLPPQTHVLSIVASGTNLFAGTSNSGVWRLPLAKLPVEKTN